MGFPPIRARAGTYLYYKEVYELSRNVRVLDCLGSN